MVNGTSALHIALLVEGIGEGDEVLVPSLTFIAPINAIRYTGAYPVFMDSEPEYWGMDPQKLADFLREECRRENGMLKNKQTGRTVKCILPVHIMGHPCNMDPILRLAQEYGLKVIEDATESLGSKYKGQMLGKLGEIGCFSFNGNKIITTGGGGMLVTDNPTLAKKAKYLSTQAKDDPVEFVHREVGFNFRLSNIQAAMGCAQLERLEEFIQKKRKIASTYNQAFAALPGVRTPKEAPWAFSIHWLYTILVDPARYGMDRKVLMNRLTDSKIQTRPLWQPGHLSPAHADCQAYHCDVAAYLNQNALSLPCSVGLKEEEQAKVIEKISLLHQ